MSSNWPRGKVAGIKWAIWMTRIGRILFLAISAGGYHTVNPLFQLAGGAT